jgi:hypothetical protein
MAIAKFLEDASADPTCTRFQKILLATYTSAIVPGPKGAADRRTLIEYYAGKPKQSVDLSNEAGDLAIPTVRVHFVKPCEDDQTAATEAPTADGP